MFSRLEIRVWVCIEIKENEILLRSYLNRENVSKYINNSEKTNAFNRVKRGTKFNNVKTYINGIVSTKITNEQRVQNQKIKLEQNRNELQKILSELTNLTNTNKNEILSKFNSNGKLNNAKTLAIQKDRDIKKSKLENLKSNLTTFLENKNVNNKGTYINRLNAGEDISNLKREILGVINKKNAERKNYDLKLRELSVLLNSSKNLNNSMKAKFLRNFEKTRNFNKVRKNVEDEFKKINNARKQGEITFRNADQKKLLQKILNNSKNFTNDDKRMFMQRLEVGNNFNTLKGNAIQAARNLAKKRKNRELEQKMKAEAEYKEEQRRQQRKLLNKIMNNSKHFNNAEKNVFRQRFNSGENFTTLKENAIKRAQNLKAERVRKEKELLEEQEKKRIRNEQQRLLSKILNNSKNMTNENKVTFLQRFNKGENFNTIKSNAIKRAQNLKAERVQKEKELLEEQEKKRIRNEQQRLLSKILNNSKNMTNENKVPFLQRFNKGENFNVIKSNAIHKEQNLKRNRVQREKNELNRQEKKRIRNEQQRLLSKILNNSKNMTNENKVPFLRRFNKGENFNVIKSNAIRKAQNLKRNRVQREKNELNRKSKEEEEENRLAKEEANRKAKNEENRLAKEEANRKAKNEENRLEKEEANKIQRDKNELNRQEKKRIRNEQQRLLSKIINNLKNMTNENKVPFLARFNKGENFNTVKGNAIRKAQNLKRNRVQREKNELNRKSKEEEEENRLAKEEANRIQREKNELNRQEKKRIRNEQQRLLSKILNNSKNMTNENKVPFLARFNKGENFNTVKGNAIRKAQNLKRNRVQREKNELNRKSKEEE